jgi:hypothetical protein
LLSPGHTTLDRYRYIYLQAVLEQLVHLGHLGGDGEVDGAVADLDDETAADIRVDLGHDLELLALADVLGLGDGGFEAVEGLVVEGLDMNESVFISPRFYFQYTLKRVRCEESSG